MLFCPLSITEEKQKYDVIDIFELYHKDLLKITAQKLKAAGDPNYIVDRNKDVTGALRSKMQSGLSLRKVVKKKT